MDVEQLIVARPAGLHKAECTTEAEIDRSGGSMRIKVPTKRR